MADIFLSYRRQDTQSATGRLADQLEQHFGPRRVFRDYDSIVAGADFADSIDSAISISTVVLAVVGPGWSEVCDAEGRRRLDDEGDFVRLEIEAALRANVPVIPVLVEGATMPSAKNLPESLRAFSRCNAVELVESRWREDAEKLIASLRAQFGLESDVSSSATAGGEKIDAFSRFALDMLELATHPRRLIARQQTGNSLDHVRAFLFLCACLFFGNLGLILGIGLPGATSWLIIGMLFGIILITLLSLPLAFAWRLWGTRISFRQVTLIFAYVYGGAWIGFCAGALLLAMGAQLNDSRVFTRFMAIAQMEQPLQLRVWWVQTLFGNSMHGPAIGMAVIAGLVWVATVIWVIGAWGAFRISYNAGRWRALAATLTWLLLVVAVIQLASLASR